MSNEITERKLRYQWTSFPLMERPKQSLMLLILITFLIVIVWQFAMWTVTCYGECNIYLYDNADDYYTRHLHEYTCDGDCVWHYPQPLLFLLGMIILFAGIMPYLVPTQYYFYENDLKVQYLFIKVEKKYTDFGCFYTDKMGVMLCTFKMPRRLDRFRGQSIRFSKSQTEREEIIAFLKEKIGKQY
jgi:hypothetical protein